MKHFFILLIAVVMTTSGIGFSSASRDDTKSNEHGFARVLARTEADVAAAENAGCRLARKTRELAAYVCRAHAADILGLPEDIKVFAFDAQANQQIKADLVHAAGNTGAGRKVAIIDTGYNYLHRELASSYLGGIDLVNNDNDPMDDNGHGSHVAGIITADGINAAAKGVAPDAGVIAVKALAANGRGYFSDVVAGIYWIVDGPDGIATTSDDGAADAINLSLGTEAPYLYKGFCNAVLPEMTSAIQYARSRGTLVAAAAGNSGRSGVSFPGCISAATTIGAVDFNDKIARFSGQGSAVDLTAPGVNMLSSVLGDDYAIFSGTSMATPVVSAVAALARYAHPLQTVSQVESAMFATARDLGTVGKDKVYGWGRVDASGAVK